MISNNNIVASFYKFSPWADYKSFKGTIQTICEKTKFSNHLAGSEGINGSISGDEMSIKNVMTYVSHWIIFQIYKSNIQKHLENLS